MRPHPKNAQVDPSNPRAWGTCDRCGFIWNLYRLDYQFEWQGPELQNTRYRVCPICEDVPFQHNRPIVVPLDPEPVADPRPQQYAVEEA